MVDSVHTLAINVWCNAQRQVDNAETVLLVAAQFYLIFHAALLKMDLLAH
jgi:hypothetical protein